MPPHAANAAAPMTTTLRLPGISNADAFNKPRKSTSVLSPAGTEMAQRCARALQKRSDNNGCATRLSPQTLLFATQSLARLNKIAEDSQETPQKLVSYLGLNPTVRQSGSGPSYYGRISKQGPGRARGLLVEAAWAAARAPGPLRAFLLRTRSRRGQHVAAVATEGKIAVLVWHILTKQQDYLWVRPALHATKLRRLELTAGHAPARGQRGSAYDYNIKATRDQQRRRVQQAEKVYERFVAGWNRNGPKMRTSAAKEERQ